MTTTQTQPAKKLGPTDVVTPEFRCGYPTLFEPRKPDPNKPEKQYGVEMYFRVKQVPGVEIPPGEKLVSIEPLKAAIIAAIEEKWGKDQKSWPKNLKLPLKDGANPDKADKSGWAPGVVVVRANRKEEFGPPIVVDQKVKAIPAINKGAIYGGCYCYAKIHAHAWEHPTGGKGVSFTLDMIQLSRDGEPFGNRMAAEDAFSSIAVPEVVGTGKPGASEAAPAASAGTTLFGDLT